MTTTTFDRMYIAVVAAFEGCGEAWIDDNAGDRLAYVAADTVSDLLSNVTDAQVLRALNAHERKAREVRGLTQENYTDSDSLDDWGIWDVETMRAALEAMYSA